MDEQQPICVCCLAGHCDLCTGRDGTRWCEHGCGWLLKGDL